MRNKTGVRDLPDRGGEGTAQLLAQVLAAETRILQGKHQYLVVIRRCAGKTFVVLHKFLRHCTSVKRIPPYRGESTVPVRTRRRFAVRVGAVPSTGLWKPLLEINGIPRDMPSQENPRDTASGESPQDISSGEENCRTRPPGRGKAGHRAAQRRTQPNPVLPKGCTGRANPRQRRIHPRRAPRTGHTPPPAPNGRALSPPPPSCRWEAGPAAPGVWTGTRRGTGRGSP